MKWAVPCVLLGAAGLLPAACSSPYGTVDASTPAPPPVDGAAPLDATGVVDASTPPDASPSPLPECGAQRTVHLVAGNGSLAWFTLLWPLPVLITNPQQADAFDDPGKAGAVASSTAAHPLYARKVGPELLFGGLGAHPDPTAFVAGTNQTHTFGPITTTLTSMVDVVAAGAVAQKVLAPRLGVMSFDPRLAYGKAAFAPIVVQATTIDTAVAALKSAQPSLTSAEEQDVRPSPATLSKWTLPTAPATHTTLAARLLFAANAFRLGFIGTVLIPAIDDDPHGAFASGTTAPGQTADDLALVLDSFYAELAKHTEPSCGHRGAPLSLADNVVLIISGDTPKNSFERADWADATVGSSNFVYARTNGWLEPGWFGEVTSTARTNFDPATGLLDAQASASASTDGALRALLFAITRGNAALVGSVAPGPFSGIVSTAPP